MSRRALVLVFTLVVSAPAWAQQPGAGPPMPMAVDLTKVKVGSWSDYTVTFGSGAAMKSRMALVARGKDGDLLETTIEGGMVAAVGGKVITDMTMLRGKKGEGRVTKMVFQIGPGEPMEMPMGGDEGQQFSKPDPKKLVGTETIKVAAGTFKTKHYRDQTAQGDRIEYWVDETVAPIGLVKLEGEMKANPMLKDGFKFELAGKGTDAKKQITKRAKPFDPSAFAPPGAAPPGPPAAPPTK
jgi:hypothetical protein